MLGLRRFEHGEYELSEPGLFLEHWTDIDAERMTRYDEMYQWSAAAEAYYRAAEIGEGQVVADFGCGPGHIAVEFARRVGKDGHVHALDINADSPLARGKGLAGFCGVAKLRDEASQLSALEC